MYTSLGASSTLSTFNLDTESLSSNFSFNWNYSPLIIDNNGNDFYYLDYNSDVFTSKNLANGSTNWTFQYGTDVRFFLPVTTTNTITVTGYENTYSINKTTGVDSIISPLNFLGINGNTYYNSYNSLDSSKVLIVNFPNQLCTPSIPPACVFYNPMDVKILNYSSHTTTNTYHKDNFGGSSVRGRYIGEKLYSVPIIPLLNLKSLLILFMLLLLGLTYKTRFS